MISGHETERVYSFNPVAGTGLDVMKRVRYVKEQLHTGTQPPSLSAVCVSDVRSQSVPLSPGGSKNTSSSTELPAANVQQNISEI